MLTALLATVLLAEGPAASKTVETLPFDPASIASQPRATIRAAEEGREVSYEGVPLASLLPTKPSGATAMGAVKSLADAVILVRGVDGYQVAISAAAVAMDSKGERYLLAVARDGKPLGEHHGPVQLVIPGDPMKVRWCRAVASARLVRVGSFADAP